MTRRSFLSMFSCAALSAVVPKRTYVFLDGLWQADGGIVGPANYVIGQPFVLASSPIVSVDAVFFNGMMLDPKDYSVDLKSGMLRWPIMLPRTLSPGVWLSGTQTSEGFIQESRKDL